MRIPPRSARMRAILLACLGAGLVGCGGDSTAPPDVTPASITLTPAGTASLVSGASLTVSAAVLNKEGAAVSGAVVSWASSDATVASVSSGVVTAAKVGTAIISATSGVATASVSITVTPGAATQLAVRTQPAGAPIGTALATQPVVEVRDAAGNLVTTSTAAITASIASGGGTLGGTTTVNAVGGVASFLNLVISGTAGDRTLSFSGTGLSSVTSGVVTMTPPPVAIIAVDSSHLSFNTTAGNAPAPVTLHVTDAGSAPLTGLTFGSPAYDAGQPTGWITTTLSSPNAPATVTIAPSAATLTPGTYHALVPLAAAGGAANSPVMISVSLVVAPAVNITYGTSSQKVAIVDVGNAASPAISVTDATGNPLPGVSVSFASRATSIATVDASGKITAQAPGDAWVVATTSAGTMDSAFVIVPRSANAPVLRTNTTSWVEHAGDTVLVAVVLDTRGTTVGAASLSVGLQVNPPVWNYATYAPAAGPPTPIVNNSTGDILRVSVGAANGMTGIVPLVTLKLVSRTPGVAGWITLLALDVSGVDGSDMTPITTSTRLPLVIK